MTISLDTIEHGFVTRVRDMPTVEKAQMLRDAADAANMMKRCFKDCTYVTEENQEAVDAINAGIVFMLLQAERCDQMIADDEDWARQ